MSQLKLLLPFLFLICMLLPPTLETLLQYFLLGKGNWQYWLLSTNDFISGISYSIFFMFFINMIRGIPFYRLMIYGGFCYILGLSMTSVYFYIENFSKTAFFIIRLFITMFNSFGADLLLVPMIGEISKYLPEGFESTGVTFAISFFNLSSILNGILSGKEISTFAIHEGYYERAKEAFEVNIGFRVLMMFLSPLLLVWAVKG